MHFIRVGGGFYPEGLGEGSFAAVVNRQGLGPLAEVLVAGHETLVKFLGKIVHFQPLMVAVQGFFPLAGLLPVKA